MKRFLFAVLAMAVSGLFRWPAPDPKVQTAASAGAGRGVRIAYLKKHALPIRSIDSEDADFADLEPLRRVIGNRRIVMLGEATHGDGAAFAAKVRLIKFLHERMGFDVLALEGGFYDVHRVWSGLQAGEDPLPTIRSGIFEEWGDSLQLLPLWRYVVERLKTDRPLELCGFDLQFTGGISREYFVKDLYSYLTGAGILPEAARLAARLPDPLHRLMDDLASFQAIKPGDRAAVQGALDELGRALGRRPPLSGPGEAGRAYWIQLLRSTATLLELAWSLDLASLGKQTVDTRIFNLRDRQMGENLIWLAKKTYPTRKIVIWAATSHLIRNRDAFKNPNDPLISMGAWIDKEMGPDVYTLGFSAYRGRWGTVAMSEPADIKIAAEDSLEDLLFRTNFEFAWLDFRGAGADGLWLREPLSGRLLGHEPRTADWTRIVDGVFFIREMFPSARIEQNHVGCCPRQESGRSPGSLSTPVPREEDRLHPALPGVHAQGRRGNRRGDEKQGRGLRGSG